MFGYKILISFTNSSIHNVLMRQYIILSFVFAALRVAINAVESYLSIIWKILCWVFFCLLPLSVVNDQIDGTTAISEKANKWEGHVYLYGYLWSSEAMRRFEL